MQKFEPLTAMILALWHGQHFMMPFIKTKERPSRPKG